MIWVHVSAYVVRDAAGAPHHTIGIISDITARKQAEAERERVVATLAARVKSQDGFLAMLAHELRNPLAPIRNSCFILDRAERDTEPAKRARAVIERQVAQMTHLIDELLDVTRIVTGKIQLHPVPVELTEIVERTVADHQSSFTALGVALTMAPRTDACWANVDVVRIVQVLGNLLGNAGKFTHRGGETVVAITSDPGHQQVVISVRDNGPGLAPELVSTMFEPFTQAATTLDRSTGGLGLGLAVVKGLVEMHGGSVEVQSEGLGHGSEFKVKLPMIAAVSDGASGRVVARDASHGVDRILVVEDNIDAADTLRMSLELCGHEIEVAHDGPSALTAARRFAPDVVVCDIGLPGMTGYEVARAMRSDPQLVRVPLVALSGYASAADRAAAREAGFDGHLAKPVNLQELIGVLAQVAHPRG